MELDYEVYKWMERLAKDAHHYRAENPLAHLHEDEAPVETDKLKSFH